MRRTKKGVIYFEDDSMLVGRRDYVKGKCDMLPHDHNFLTISLMLRGQLVEHTNEGTIAATAGTLLIKPPSLIHSNLFTEDCTILSLILFDWEHYKFDCNNWEVIHQNMLLKNFLNIVENRNKKKSIKALKSDLEIINKNSKINVKRPEWIMKVRDMIKAQFLEPLQINKLAAAVNKHPVHLGRTFKACFQIDIKTYQQQLRMHFAMSEMIAQEKNLTEIAYSSGFSDQSHFSKTFKKNAAFTPRKASALLNV